MYRIIPYGTSSVALSAQLVPSCLSFASVRPFHFTALFPPSNAGLFRSFANDERDIVSDNLTRPMTLGRLTIDGEVVSYFKWGRIIITHNRLTSIASDVFAKPAAWCLPRVKAIFFVMIDTKISQESKWDVIV